MCVFASSEYQNGFQMHAATIRNRMNFDPSKLLGDPVGKLVLEIDKGDGRPRTFRLSGAKCAIGADERCEIRIKGKGIRPVHCVILRGENRTTVRRWAANTWLNGKPFDDSPLRQGDEIRLANLSIRIVADERSARTDRRGGRLSQALSQAQGCHDWPQDTESGTAPAALPRHELMRRLVAAEARASKLQYELASGRYDASQLVARIENLESHSKPDAPGSEPSLAAPAPQQDDVWIAARRELELELATANERITQLEIEREEQEGVCQNLQRDLEELRTTAGAEAAKFELQRAESERKAAELAETLAEEIASREVEIARREADLQVRLEKLEERRVHEEQEARKYTDQLSSRIEDLSRSLEKRERDIEHYRQELAHRIEELEDSRRQLFEQAERFAAERDSWSTFSGAKVAEREEHWEAESEKWRQQQAQLKNEIGQLQQHAAEAEQQREMLSRELSEARQQQEEQAACMAAASDQQQQLAAEFARVEQERLELDGLRRQLERDRQENEQRQRSLAAEEQQIADDQRALQEDQDKLARSLEDLGQSQEVLAQSQQELEQAAEELAQSREELEQSRIQLELDQQSLEQERQQLDDARVAFETDCARREQERLLESESAAPSDGMDEALSYAAQISDQVGVAEVTGPSTAAWPDESSIEPDVGRDRSAADETEWTDDAREPSSFGGLRAAVMIEPVKRSSKPTMVLHGMTSSHPLRTQAQPLPRMRPLNTPCRARTMTWPSAQIGKGRTWTSHAIAATLRAQNRTNSALMKRTSSPSASMHQKTRRFWTRCPSCVPWAINSTKLNLNQNKMIHRIALVISTKTGMRLKMMSCSSQRTATAHTIF